MLGLILAQQVQVPKFRFPPPPTPRPFQIRAQGGGYDRNNGFGGSVDANVRAWQSNNGRHSVDVNGGLSKYGIGSRWGSSPTEHRYGAQYNYRF